MASREGLKRPWAGKQVRAAALPSGHLLPYTADDPALRYLNSIRGDRMWKARNLLSWINS
jgi:hypothetical protein